MSGRFIATKLFLSVSVEKKALLNRYVLRYYRIETCMVILD